MVRLGLLDNSYILVLLLMIAVISCKNEPQKTKDTPKSKPIEKLKIPAFSADSAYLYTQEQVDLGPRVPGTQAHKKAIEYYQNKLQSFGAQVRLQKFTKKRFDGLKLNGTNIVASYNPEKKKRIFLCAHWDSRYMAEKAKDPALKNKPIDGADDGATGVGVLLEIARQIQKNPLKEVGLDIILFDLEDQGKNGADPSNIETWGLGSQYWSSTLPRDYKPRFGVLLDMVGAKGAIFPKEGYSLQNAPSQTNKIWRLAQGMGYGHLFINDRGGSITDDHYFIMKNAKIPVVDIIHTRPNGQFGAYHHTPLDNMDIVDKATLKATGQTTLAVVYHFHNGSF